MGGAALIVIGATLVAIDWQNMYALGLSMIIGGAYVLVRSFRELRKWYDTEKIQSGPYEVVITDTGVALEGPSAVGQYEWRFFTAYGNTPNATVLFYSRSYITLPNRALTPRALADLRTVIATHLKPLPDAADKPTKRQVGYIVILLALAIFFLVTAVHNLVSHRH